MDDSRTVYTCGRNWRKRILPLVPVLLCLIPFPAPSLTPPREDATDRLLTLFTRFRSPEFGPAAAVRHFRMKIIETRDLGHDFGNIRLAPPPGVHRLDLETHEGRLVGIRINYTFPGTPIDTGRLRRLWGEPRRGPAPLDSFFPASFIFTFPLKQQLLTVILQPGERVPLKAAPIISVILRRFPPDTKIPGH